MSTLIEKSFADAERHVAEVAAAIVSGEPQSLGIASASLRQATLTLTDAVQLLSPFPELGAIKRTDIAANS